MQFRKPAISKNQKRAFAKAALAAIQCIVAETTSQSPMHMAASRHSDENVSPVITPRLSRVVCHELKVFKS